MKIIYAASPAIAVPALEVLHDMEGIELAGILTNPDTSKGRHGKLLPTEIGEAAEKFSVPVLKPEKLDTSAREKIAALKPDLLVSFAYGFLFGPKFLALFPSGGINIHPSLLPKYRGPSPIQAAILNRDTVTGISVQKLALEMDSGDILASEQFELTGQETAYSLGGIMAQKAAVLLPLTLKKIAAGSVQAAAQNHSEATYCSLISRDDSLVNWNAGAAEIDAKIRAFYPWPLCRTVHNGRELFILKAAVFKGSVPQGERKPALVLGMDKQYGILIQTGEGILAVTELQYQAKKALFWKDFLNGARDFIGSILG
jgi:methionyl-tRNA formyltransferase